MTNLNPGWAPTRIAGYFRGNAIHARNYHVSDIPADRLSHVIYAFAGVSTDGNCISLNAQDDQVNFPQLLQLKRQFPNVMTLISVGGAADSSNFPAVAATDASRLHFARSCVQFMKQNGFDGIDIDWEFPGALDKSNFTALLTALRHQLDVLSCADDRQYLLTIAAPSRASQYANLELSLIHPLLDWINLMTYDFTSAASKLTDFDAPLKIYDPAVTKHATENVDAAVRGYLKADRPTGTPVPADKIVIGVHFIGTGWQGVPNANNGLYQTNTGPAKGTYFLYKDLKQNYLGKYARFWHPEAQVPWLYSADAKIMISYEDPQSLAARLVTLRPTISAES